MIKDTLLMIAGVTILALVLLSSMNAGFIDGWYERSVEVPFDIYENQLCWQDGYQSVDCVRFDNVYHEGLMPFEIKGVNPKTKVVRIHVNDYFTRGDDGSCQAFGTLVNNILEEMPEGWGIFVTNEFVPSSKNPIDLGWSRTLAKGY